MFHPAPPGWNLPRKREDAPWASAPEFVLRSGRPHPGPPIFSCKENVGVGCWGELSPPAQGGWAAQRFTTLWAQQHNQRFTTLARQRGCHLAGKSAPGAPRWSLYP